MQNEVTTRFIRCHNELKDRGLIPSTRQFSMAIDTHPQSVNEILKGRREATIEMVVNITKVYKVSADYLLKGTGEMFEHKKEEERQDNIVYVPYAAQAGHATQFIESTSYNDNMKFSIPGYHPSKGEHRCFDVSGDSMEPTLYSNDKIICSMISPDHFYNAIRDNYVYVVITSHEILVKRVKNRLKTHGTLLLRSDNAFYEDIEIKGNEIKEIWIVNMTISHFMPDPNNVKNAFHEEINRLKSTIKSQGDSLQSLNKSIETLLRKNRSS